ncbi:MAG: hypothetical protein ACE5GD_00050 [Candidatus Geothermarchaeales archaeon]
MKMHRRLVIAVIVLIVIGAAFTFWPKAAEEEEEIEGAEIPAPPEGYTQVIAFKGRETHWISPTFSVKAREWRVRFIVVCYEWNEYAERRGGGLFRALISYNGHQTLYNFEQTARVQRGDAVKSFSSPAETVQISLETNDLVHSWAISVEAKVD